MLLNNYSMLWRIIKQLYCIIHQRSFYKSRCFAILKYILFRNCIWFKRVICIGQLSLYKTTYETQIPVNNNKLFTPLIICILDIKQGLFAKNPKTIKPPTNRLWSDPRTISSLRHRRISSLSTMRPPTPHTVFRHHRRHRTPLAFVTFTTVVVCCLAQVNLCCAYHRSLGYTLRLTLTSSKVAYI